MNTLNLINECEVELKDIFNKIDNNTLLNSEKVINAFHDNMISESDLNGTNGYGYNDIGRDKIEKIFAQIMDAEAALVRNQFISGSHAINVALFGLLRPGDILLSISGTPYDTLQEVIGIKKNNSSLISYGIKYNQIDLIDNDFDYKKIEKSLNDVKVIHIQRSRGYSYRDSLSIKKLEKVIKLIKKINKDIIIFVDNCYCEFVEEKFPTSIGADLIAGSLIKNLGAGIASNGAYLAGKKDLIELCAERLTLPGEGINVGPSQGANKMFLMGIYFAPSVVSNALKISILTSLALEKLGYKVSPTSKEERSDIVQLIYFKDEKEVIRYATAIQNGGAIDSHVNPVAAPMPGYEDKIIMASPSFTQGSSIELSCDAPLKEPYVLFQQGSLTYEYGKLTIIKAIDSLQK